MKYQVLFYQKNNEKLFKTVVCCSRDRRFKGKRNTLLTDSKVFPVRVGPFWKEYEIQGSNQELKHVVFLLKHW